jgi:DNA-binding Lrp family transcriptional regulator
MPKELPSVEEKLKGIVEAKTPLSVIAKKLGVSEESVGEDSWGTDEVNG